LCRDACPQDVLALAEELNSRGYRPVILLDPAHNCTGCALCAVVCPDGCITVYRDIVPKGAAPKRQPANGHTPATALSSARPQAALTQEAG
jgi:2-oxoglutarate ferredoxin oxidoreductase subunit delta